MAEVKTRLKKGNITLSLIVGEYQGKPTRSFTINKRIRDRESGEWKDSDFFSPTDLNDLRVLVDKVLITTVKVEEIKPKPPEEPVFDEKTPF